ncbi:MAG: YfhO family protein [Lachnospiraceae bacterium]|nr:YfhO family protein [Lachnospiraceae bacterium]
MQGVRSTKEYSFKPALIAGAIVLAMFFVVLFLSRITPFGDNTFLMYDMKRQYVDYYSYLRTVLFGKNDLLYSFSTTLGAGMVGFEVYYLSSPFLLLLCLIPQAYIPLGVTFIIGVKLYLAAAIMSIYLQRTVGSEHSIVSIIGGVTWGFSSFIFAHSMNMMWIDVVILFPLIIWAIEELIENKNRIFYIVILSLILYLNYYITYQIIVFLFLWTLFFFFVRRPQNPFRAIGRIIYSSLLSAGIDAALLIPTALELFNSPKDIGQLGLSLNGNNLIIRDVFSKLPSCSYDYIEARFGWPQVFCGVLFIILTLLYFLDNHRKLKERIGTLVLFGILLFSFCNDAVNLFWHAGMEPSGHPYRYAYMWIFLMVLSSSKAMADRDIISFRKTIISFAIVAVMFYEVLRIRYDHISSMTIYLNWALLATYFIIGIVYIFVLKKNLKKGTLAILILVGLIQTSDLGLNASYTYHWQSVNNNSMKAYVETINATKNTIDKIKAMDDGFYRMENYNPRQQNDAMQYDFKGVTHYSSAGMTYVRYFLRDLGFNDDGLYTHYGFDNTVTMDSLLGIKYLVSDGTHRMHPSYEKIIDDNVSAYKNPYALSVAIGVNDFNVDVIDDEDPFDYQERIYSSLLGEKINIFKKADFKMTEDTKDDVVFRHYAINPSIDGELYMYLADLENVEQGLVVYINGELYTGYGNASSYKVLNLGYYSKDDTVLIDIEADTKDPTFGEELFVTEDLSVLEDAYNTVNLRSLDIEEISSSHLKINTEKYDGIFTTISFEEGWRILANRYPEKPMMLYDALLYIPLDDINDVNVVDLKFTPKGLITGIMISIISIAVFGIMISNVLKAKKAEANKTEDNGGNEEDN